MDNNQLNLNGKWMDFRRGDGNIIPSSQPLTIPPFVSHSELIQALNSGVISIPMNTVVMYEVAKIISILPWKLFVISSIIPIPVIVYISFLNSWSFIISLLFIPIALGIFHPTTAKSLQPISSILAIIVYLGFIYGLSNSIMWVYLVCGIGIFYHLAWTISAAFSRNLSDKAICNDVSLVNQLWQNKQIFIKFKDGRTFFPE